MFIQINDYEGIINTEELDVITGSSDLVRQKAESRAIAKISKMIGRQYDALALFSQSGEARDLTLVEYTIYFALYILYGQIAKDKVPDDRYAQYKEAKDFFEAARKDEIDTGWPRILNSDGQEAQPIIRMSNNTPPTQHYY